MCNGRCKKNTPRKGVRKGSPTNGKGCKRRPGDCKKYRDNYDKIFGKEGAEDAAKQDKS